MKKTAAFEWYPEEFESTKALVGRSGERTEMRDAGPFGIGVVSSTNYAVLLP